MLGPIRFDASPHTAQPATTAHSDTIHRLVGQIDGLVSRIHDAARRGHDCTDLQQQTDQLRTQLRQELSQEIANETQRGGLSQEVAEQVVSRRYNDSEVDAAIKGIDSERALGDLATAENDTVKNAGTTNFRVGEATAENLSGARAELKQSVQSEGADAILARHPNDPAVRSAVAQAGLDIAQDNLTAQENQIPNLHQVRAQDQGATSGDAMKNLRGADGKPLSLAQYKQLVAAREQVMIKRTALQHDLNDQVLSMRTNGMSRVDALSQLRNEGYGDTLGATSDTLENGKMPTTIGMTDAERGAYYERNFLDNPATSDDAKKAYQSGQPVILAVRHDTTLSANNEEGVYDDRFVVLQKTSGGVSAREFDSSQDPTTQYGDGLLNDFDLPGSADDGQVGKYAKNDTPWYQSFDTMSWHRTYAPTRLADGQTIQLSTGPDGQQTDGWGTLEKLYTPANGGYQVQGDLNGDGVFGNDGQRDHKTAGGNEFQLHAGKADYSHTGTDGCVTVPEYEWNDFRAATGLFNGNGDQRVNQAGNIYYVQVNESTLRQ
ncbi:hypothetical protein ACPPVV_08360 [Rhodanobacter sp. Col0626]|uniref:hypothetical protein n=1 Tax=Rhodanobacter sp. Col0626 TaxID=3415679 RepID=UPI003CF16057